MSTYTNIFDDEVEDGSDGNADPSRTSESQKYAPERVQAGSEHTVKPPHKVDDRRLHAGVVAMTGPTRQQASAPGKPKLVALYGDRGQLLVAHHVDGNPVEGWRSPSQQETEELAKRGMVIQSGATAFKGSGPTGLGAFIPESTVGRVVLGAVVVAAVGAAAIYGKQKWDEYQDEKEDEGDDE